MADPILLYPEEVTTLEQAEAVACIRNSCRHRMTRDQSEISAKQQAQWWHALDRANNRLFLFHAVGDVWSTAVGYGLCRRIDGQWWVSGGLTEEWRGRGFGRLLFNHLLNVTGKPCWLEVFADNTPAMRTYLGLGFVGTRMVNGVVVMVNQ